MRLRLRVLGLLVLVPVPVLAACGGPDPETPNGAKGPTAILPLRTLRLYETGVGYFERSGEIGGRSATSLPVPAGHLDDALKSLVVLNSGAGGQVAGVAFASSVTHASARARAGLPAEGGPIAFRDLLVSMKGERVSIDTRGGSKTVAGRLVEVTDENDEAAYRASLVQTAATTPSKEGTVRPKPEEMKRLVLALLTERGEITLVDAQDVIRIRPQDAAFAKRLDASLDALSTRSAQNSRTLGLLGDAKGNVTFGYIAETPVWRASYRLIGSPDSPGGVTLQGWSLVHNDTDERWQGVHLELVNGEPDSFVFPLAAPRYARRSLVHPDDPLSTLPQLQDTTADAIWGDNVDSSGMGAGGTGVGYGSGHGMMYGSHTTKAPSLRTGSTSVDGRIASSSVLAVGNLADIAQAKGTENGALFSYAVPGPFTLDAHASALVPFLQKAVQVESIAYFDTYNAPARAGVRFINNTGQTLPAGTLAVFGPAGFSGETMLDRLKPGERRVLQVGNDLDAAVKQKTYDRAEESKRLTFDHNTLEEHFLLTERLDWELENRSGQKRTFYVKLTAEENATIKGADRLDFDDTAKRPLVIFELLPRTKVDRPFVVTAGLSRSSSIDNLTSKGVRDLLAKTTISSTDLGILTQAAPRITALEAEHARSKEADTATSVAETELERLREDMKALGGGDATKGGGGGGVAAAPLVKRVLDAEDRLELARKNKEASQRELEKRREGVREILGRLGTR